MKKLLAAGALALAAYGSLFAQTILHQPGAAGAGAVCNIAPSSGQWLVWSAAMGCWAPSSGIAVTGLPNLVLATDPSGSSSDSAYLRALVAADIPALNYQTAITGAPGSWPSTFAPINTGNWAGNWQTYTPSYFQPALSLYSTISALTGYPSTFPPVNTGNWAGTWQTYAPSYFQQALSLYSTISALTGYPSTFAPSAHNLLSVTHGDTTASSAVRGGAIFAIGASPLWTQVAHSSVAGGYWKWNGTDVVASTGAAAGTGSCSNKAVTAENADAGPTCSTITSAYVDTSIAQTGVDVNTSNQVTATHLASGLPRSQGGLNSTSAGTGILRDGATPAASEISGDCTTSGSNSITCTKTSTVAFGTFATLSNPMTTKGDFLYGGVSGAPTRLAVPTDGTYCPSWSSGVPTWITCPGAGGGISSIGLTMPGWLSVTNSPMTSNGTIAVSAATGQTSHQVIGTCGSATSFGACALVAGDIPAIPLSGLATALSAVNPETATYQVLPGDFSSYKTITVASGTFTITLVASGSQPAAGQYIRVVNYGSGVVTVARSGQNINGGTASLTIPAATATAPMGAFVQSDGTNYFASQDTPPAVTTLASLTSANGTTIPASATLLTSGGALGTPSSGNASNLTNFPTLNQPTTANAGTATALASAPSTCSAGQGATGVAASGNAQGCTAYVQDAADLGGTAASPQVTNGSHITNSSIPNSGLVNVATTVNGQTCTLGATCTVTLSAVNPQTATYQVLPGDFSSYKTITVASGTFTITLVSSGSQPAAGQYVEVINYGSGVVTIARSGQNLNGGTASLTLSSSSATAPTEALITSDGTNYFASMSIGPAVTTLASLSSANGTTIPSSATLLTSGGALGTPSSGNASNLTNFPATLQTTTGSLASNTGLTYGQIPATNLPSPGTSITLNAPRGYAVCTGTCTVTLPTPAAGYEFCALNDDNVSTVITIAAISGVYFEKAARTAYETVNTAMTSGGAAADKICMIGRDSTHYLTVSYNGTWTP